MKGIIALVVSILLGIVAVLAVRSYLERERSVAQARFQPVAVVKTSQRIVKGERVTGAMLADASGAVSTAEYDKQVLVRDRDRILGLVATRDIERGTNIKWTDLVLEEQKTTLPNNMVLLALPVDNISGVAGLVKPESRVDIIGAFTLPAKDGRGSSGASATRLLTNVQVFAVDNRTTEEAYAAAPGRATRQYSTVTVVVTPQEALILTFARAQGALTLSIRNPQDELARDLTDIGPDNVIEKAREADAKRLAAEGNK